MPCDYKPIPIIQAAHRAGVRLTGRWSGNEVLAYCPFCHGLTTHPHLYLNVCKDQFYCHRCGAHGNSVTLYARMRGISNRAAFDELCRGGVALFPLPAPSASPKDIAPLARRDLAYRVLLEKLPLAQHHLVDLLGRGLTLEAIQRNGYRTLIPDGPRRRDLVTVLARQADLHGVPGFYKGPDGQWQLAGPGGLLIAYRTASGSIQGLQIRLDASRRQRYLWLSSNPAIRDNRGRQRYPGGTAAQAWAHVTGDIHSETAAITEGALKGDTASSLSGNALYLCVPGVNAVGHLAEAIRSLSLHQLHGEFDMDQIDHGQHSTALQALEEMLRPLGIPFSLQTWNPAHNGIDEHKLYSRPLPSAA